MIEVKWNRNKEYDEFEYFNSPESSKDQHIHLDLDFNLSASSESKKKGSSQSKFKVDEENMVDFDNLIELNNDDNLIELK